MLPLSSLNSITQNGILHIYGINRLLTVAVLYQLLKKKKLTLDKLESKSILYFFAVLLFIFFFVLFLKFTSMEKDSVEGKVFALVFVLLVFAFVNLIFFIMGLN